MIACLFVVVLPLLAWRLDARRKQAIGQAKARHPAKGTQTLEDSLEWLLILEAIGSDEMEQQR